MDSPDFHRQRAGPTGRHDARYSGHCETHPCGTFALQYMHISDPEEAGWLKERIEGLGKEIQFTVKARRS
ncbi:Hypothetical protein FKW44_016285 [Caligus rogercresseyi]|uniref:Uncharacterized protein n=1 Tax=Caligus rogercresseyi TaxID=217165 RepID=A0A7T8H290_CALRO|nr:Hypothetical protein FKW44_016285 [Caligus rogercresseyi]